jgi:addiction module HigA family antidote
MNNLNQTSLLPDYAVPPGRILEEELETLGMDPVELHKRTGLARAKINGILSGDTPITPTIALKLERVLHLPAHLWINLEQQYQSDLARLKGRKVLASHLSNKVLATLQRVIKPPTLQRVW